jgi:hypothetical protein
MPEGVHLIEKEQKMREGDMEQNSDSTVSKEWCGYRAKRWVERFREIYTGHAWTKAGAQRLASHLAGSDSSSARNLRRKGVTGEAETAFASMRRIIEYNWFDEENDFYAQDEDGQVGHLYLHLVKVSEFLSSYDC